jgi:hypothetical protein
METLEKTKDYARFKFINGNRDVSEHHVRRLMKSLQEEQLVSFVIVNGKDEIIDGQNRFEACKRLGFPVYVYKDSKTSKYGLNQVQRYNTNNLTWNKRSYLNSYCNMGVKPYMQLKEFMEQYPDFGIAPAITIFSNKPSADQAPRKREDGLRYRPEKPFEQGQLTSDDLGLAYENAGKIMEYKKYFKNFNNRSFVNVMIGLFQNKKFDHQTMIKKLELCPVALTKCSTAKQYRALVEDIYNYKSREKVNLRY